MYKKALAVSLFLCLSVSLTLYPAPAMGDVNSDSLIDIIDALVIAQ